MAGAVQVRARSYGASKAPKARGNAALVLRFGVALGMADYGTAFDGLLQDEGTRFVADPLDRGGPTRMGVTVPTLAAWRKAPTTAADVAALSVDEARSLYHAMFWHPLNCDHITSQSAANGLFSLSVLCGMREGVLLSQRAAGVEPDGHMGPATLAAINAMQQARFLDKLGMYAARYFDRVVALHPEQRRFLKGWHERISRLTRPAFPDA